MEKEWLAKGKGAQKQLQSSDTKAMNQQRSGIGEDEGRQFRCEVEKLQHEKKEGGWRKRKMPGKRSRKWKAMK